MSYYEYYAIVCYLISYLIYYLIWSDLTLPYLNLPYLTLPYLTLPYLTLPNLILSLILSYRLFYLVPYIVFCQSCSLYRLLSILFPISSSVNLVPYIVFCQSCSLYRLLSILFPISSSVNLVPYIVFCQCLGKAVWSWYFLVSSLIIHLLQNMFILHMWYKHGFQVHITPVERKRCDNESRKWYGFFTPAKLKQNKTHTQKKKKKKKKKNISPQSEHSAVLPLTPHTISNRQTCQKEKCVLNKLWCDNFHTIPQIKRKNVW